MPVKECPSNGMNSKPQNYSKVSNHESFHGLALLAITNATHEFPYVEFGTNGRVSDGGVIEKHSYDKLLNGELD